MWGWLIKLEPILSWVFIIVLTGWTIYAGLIKPVLHPNATTSQKAQVINNLTVNCKGLINVACKPNK
jgi:hypothetical protein